MVEVVLEARGVTRCFGRRRALLDVSFSVVRGEVLAVVGRNGAGKSTLIRVLTGMLEPSRGEARVFGVKPREAHPGVRERVAYVPEGHPVFEWMRVGEAAELEASSYPRWDALELERVLDAFALPRDVRGGDLSRGQRAGLSLALTLAKRPELLVLDDPTLGLDPVARRVLVRELARFAGAGGTVLLASHELADVERLADSVLLLERGAVRARCSLEALRTRVRQVLVSAPVATDALRDLPGLLDVEPAGDHVALVAVDAAGALEAQLEERGVRDAQATEVGVDDALFALLRAADRGDVEGGGR